MENPNYSLKWDADANVWVSYSHELKIYSQASDISTSLEAILDGEKIYKQATLELSSK